MKILLTLLCSVVVASAQTVPRVTTVVTQSPGLQGSTNYVTIPLGEACRVSYHNTNSEGEDWMAYVGVLRDGWWFPIAKGDTIAGPAVVAVEIAPDGTSPVAVMLSLDRWKVAKK